MLCDIAFESFHVKWANGGTRPLQIWLKFCTRVYMPKMGNFDNFWNPRPSPPFLRAVSIIQLEKNVWRKNTLNFSSLKPVSFGTFTSAKSCLSWCSFKLVHYRYFSTSFFSTSNFMIFQQFSAFSGFPLHGNLILSSDLDFSSNFTSIIVRGALIFLNFFFTFV